MSFTTITQFESELARIANEAATTPEATSAAQTAQAPQHLVDKFQAMLAQVEPNPHAVHAGGQPNIVTKAVEEQSDYYRQVPNDVLYMSQHMSSLSMERIAAADMTVQLEIASLNADLQVKMAAVQSSKDAVQTLMKNQ
jgi:type III secretion inner rod protein HrpB2